METKNPFRGIPVIPTNKTKTLMCPNCHMRPLSVLIGDTGVMVLNCQDCNASYTLKRIQIDNEFHPPLMKVSPKREKLIVSQLHSPHCIECNNLISSYSGQWFRYVHIGGQRILDDMQKYWYFFHCNCGEKNSLYDLIQREARDYAPKN